MAFNRVPMVVARGQQHNFGEKPTAIHQNRDKRQEEPNKTQSCSIRSGIGCVSRHHVISHQAHLTAKTREEKWHYLCSEGFGSNSTRYNIPRNFLRNMDQF